MDIAQSIGKIEMEEKVICVSAYLCDGNHGLREDSHGLLQDAHSSDGSKS